MKKNDTNLSYSDAGVDVERGEKFVTNITPLASSTARPGSLGTLGGFGGLFDLKQSGYQDPILVSATDGVGTKLLLAIELNRHETIGIDLVAMCVNDIIVQGAEPLWFLDYFATGNLSLEIGQSILNGIVEGCKLAGASLLGGETAEMPNVYAPGHYDLAGFCVGAVERGSLIDSTGVTEGDTILGLASNGVHSNGYSLVHKILKNTSTALSEKIDGDPIGAILLKPTRIYVKPILDIIKTKNIKGIAHITGGGLTKNVPRILPTNLDANIDLNSWSPEPIFSWLKNNGRIMNSEMLSTFNCGVGLVIIVDKSDSQNISNMLTDLGEKVFEIGEIVSGSGEVKYQNSIFAEFEN